MPSLQQAVARPFLDTNVLLYLISTDARKAERCEALLREGAAIGVQVLNEFTNAARRKFALSWDEIDDVIGMIGMRCEVHDLTLAVHEQARPLAQRFQLAWYDALIVSAALDAGSSVLYTEDMQHGLRVTPTLTLRNPFLGT